MLFFKRMLPSERRQVRGYISVAVDEGNFSGLEWAAGVPDVLPAGAQRSSTGMESATATPEVGSLTPLLPQRSPTTRLGTQSDSHASNNSQRGQARNLKVTMETDEEM